MARIARNRPGFVAALADEAAAAIADGDAARTRALLHNVAMATVGIKGLASETGIPFRSLARMLSPKGNPRPGNVDRIVRGLDEHAGVGIRAKAAGAARPADPAVQGPRPGP